MFAQEKDILIAILLANAFVLLITMAYFIFAYRITKKNKQLKLDKLKLELNASERARQDIATQLHNELGPMLSSVNMRLELVKSNGPGEIDVCQQTVSRAVGMIRKFSKELSPFGILHNTLKSAMEQYIADQAMPHLIHFDIEETKDIDISPERKNQIYRLLQEIILNTIKHSGATQFAMDISKQDHQLIIRTTDDGHGFDLKQKLRKHQLGNGLNDIFNKVDIMEGSVECVTAPGKGTKYYITIPMGGEV
jgi:signal transduction histidine kinase